VLAVMAYYQVWKILYRKVGMCWHWLFLCCKNEVDRDEVAVADDVVG